MSKAICNDCRYQQTGWDGGFFGEPMTCECKIYGEVESSKNCPHFEKRITKSDLIDKIRELEKENEQLKSNAKMWGQKYGDSYYNSLKLDDKIEELEKENEQLRKWNEYYKKELIKPIDLANLKYKDLVGRPVMRFTKEQKKELINKFKKLEKGDG